MQLNFKNKFYIFLKKNLPVKIKHYIYSILNIKNSIRIKFANFFINFLIKNIYDQDNKKIFTLRNFGGSTVSRGFSMFRTQPEIPKWIDTFDENSNFFDIGANIGLFSLYAAKKNHNVVAFEPESLNFACLNLNIKDNNLNNNIKAFPISLHNKSEISFLNLSNMKFGASGSSFDRNLSDDENSFQPVYQQGSISCTFDYLVERTAITPNYIKIDVDGNELQIIKGMTETLKNKELKSICIELNPEFKEHKEVFDILKNNFNKYEKKNWYYGQIVFNHIFYKI